MSEMIENTGMDRQKLKTFILETYPGKRGPSVAPISQL